MMLIKIKNIIKNSKVKTSFKLNFFTCIKSDNWFPKYEKIIIKGVKPINELIKNLIFEILRNERHKFWINNGAPTINLKRIKYS